MAAFQGAEGHSGPDAAGRVFTQFPQPPQRNHFGGPQAAEVDFHHQIRPPRQQSRVRMGGQSVHRFPHAVRADHLQHRKPAPPGADGAADNRPIINKTITLYYYARPLPPANRP